MSIVKTFTAEIEDNYFEKALKNLDRKVTKFLDSNNNKKIISISDTFVSIGDNPVLFTRCVVVSSRSARAIKQ